MKVTASTTGEKPRGESVVPSRRERSILRLVRAGQSVKNMADGLDITVPTLHQYLKQIFRTLGISTRAELQAWVEQHPDCLIPGRPVERRFHRVLPLTADDGCPCLWCSSLRSSTEA
jgi:DNA-binding CsgD family transcriptional regulator